MDFGDFQVAQKFVDARLEKRSTGRLQEVVPGLSDWICEAEQFFLRLLISILLLKYLNPIKPIMDSLGIAVYMVRSDRSVIMP